MAKPYIVLKSYPKALFFYPILLVTFLILLAQWIDLTLWNWSSLIGIDYIDLSNILGLIWYIVFLFFTHSVSL